MQVRDKNAEDLIEQQVDTAEVTLYIKVSDDNDNDSNNDLINIYTRPSMLITPCFHPPGPPVTRPSGSTSQRTFLLAR